MARKTLGWIVTTSGDRPAKEVAKDLKAAGFSVGQILEEIGSIIGEADERVIDKVRSIRGVADVSREGEVDIGPPDAPTTW
jgi:hypothetical protein